MSDWRPRHNSSETGMPLLGPTCPIGDQMSDQRPIRDSRALWKTNMPCQKVKLILVRTRIFLIDPLVHPTYT